MKTTANLGLKKPEGTDVVNIDDLNYNADIIDTELFKRALKTDIPSVPTKIGQLQNDSGFITSSAIPSSLPANGGNASTVNNKTANATPSTSEKVDLIGMANEVNSNLSSHKTGKATQTVLGHVKQGTGVTVDTNGVLSVATGSAGFKKGSSTFTVRGVSQSFTDAFCTVDSLVTISITSSTMPQGTWKVNSANGSFTITSSGSETADIIFDYFIQKAVV